MADVEIKKLVDRLAVRLGQLQVELTVKQLEIEELQQLLSGAPSGE